MWTTWTNASLTVITTNPVSTAASKILKKAKKDALVVLCVLVSFFISWEFFKQKFIYKALISIYLIGSINCFAVSISYFFIFDNSDFNTNFVK